jgi:hypothetical protein
MLRVELMGRQAFIADAELVLASTQEEWSSTMRYQRGHSSCYVMVCCALLCCAVSASTHEEWASTMR